MSDPGKARLVTKVALYVACNNLLNKDFGSKSDPCCALFSCDPQGLWFEVGILPFIFILGDFNIFHNNKLNPCSLKLDTIFNFFNLTQHPSFPTYLARNT